MIVEAECDLTKSLNEGLRQDDKDAAESTCRRVESVKFRIDQSIFSAEDRKSPSPQPA